MVFLFDILGRLDFRRFLESGLRGWTRAQFPNSGWLSSLYLGNLRANFKTIRQITIPYKVIQIWNTRVKPKSDFFASKGLETFHAFGAPYVNTVDADSQ